VLLGANPRAIERGVELDQLALPTVPATKFPLGSPFLLAQPLRVLSR